MKVGEFERIFRPHHMSAGPHTLDSPIRYEVWREYALASRGTAVDLLLEPAEEAMATPLVPVSRTAEAHGVDLTKARPAMIGTLIALRLPFDAFLDVVVPLTPWRDIIAAGQQMSADELRAQLEAARTAEEQGASATERTLPLPDELAKEWRERRQNLIDRFRWFSLLAIRIGFLDDAGSDLEGIDLEAGALDWLAARFASAERPGESDLIEAVSVNRRAAGAVQRSRNTIKADAADRLFDLSCAELGWAVLDSGIDARHPAFRKLKEDGRPEPEWVRRDDTPCAVRYVPLTRVVETYELTRARETLAGTSVSELRSLSLNERLLASKIDCFPEGAYVPPGNDHGTHVAGILAGNWLKADGDHVKTVLAGICPDLQLWDIRVLDDRGVGDEFSVVAGLRLVEEINRRAGHLVIHGVNVSLSIAHHAANYACGWTPVCNACSDLVDAGVVVVVAAGNTGLTDPEGTARADGTSYNTVSITDPGNAEKVITVGATHRTLPHRYGTSYFSARGPTADGRRKPDLLAPGEGITGPLPLIGGRDPDYKSYDGTSQAAPHVSGAAALLLGRYPELRGQPEQVKQILCETASDLGREPYFQGHGLVDVLRALQSQ